MKRESIQIEMSRRARLGPYDKAVFFRAIAANGLDLGPFDKEEAVKKSVVRKGDSSCAVEDESNPRDRHELVVSVFKLIGQEKTQDDK